MQWQAYLKPEEREALRQTESWIERPQGLVGKAMLFLGKPLDMAFAKVPTSVKETISQGIYSVLTSVSSVSQQTVKPQQIYDLLCQESGQDVTSPGQVRRLPLAVLDGVARRLISAQKNAATIEGGATGAAGLPGLVADIPALYYLIFRTAQEVALCYGFPVVGDSEIEHMFKVVDVGHYLESSKKRKGMLEIERLQDLIVSGAPMKDLERTMIAKGLQTLARHLATGITRRKLAQTVAIVGGVVGASVNRALVGDVGETAFYAYRRRFLMELAQTRMQRDQAYQRFLSGDDEASAAPTAADSATPVARPDAPGPAPDEAPAAQSDAPEPPADEAPAAQPGAPEPPADEAPAAQPGAPEPPADEAPAAQPDAPEPSADEAPAIQPDAPEPSADEDGSPEPDAETLEPRDPVA